jgi:hypothetical protein
LHLRLLSLTDSGFAWEGDMSEKGKSISYFIGRAEECIKIARNAPKGKQLEFLRLANELLVLGQEAGSLHCRNDLEQLHKSD